MDFLDVMGNYCSIIGLAFAILVYAISNKKK